MSLPRFLKTFHKKPDSRGLRSASDPNLSDASDSSSGPKDALGFPLPVTTVITVSPAPAHATATNESTPAVTTAQADPTPSVSTHPSSSSPSSRLTTMPKPIPSRSSTLPHSHIRDDPLLSTSCPQLPSPVSLASSPAPVPTPSPKAIHLSTFDNPNNTKRTTKSIGFEIGAPLLRSMDRDMAESAPEGVVGGANPLHAKPEPKAETSLQGSIGTSNGVQDQPVPEDDTSVGSVPAIVPTPRVRSRSGPFGSSLRPVSILKNKPKSILRWPSRPSQTDDQGMPSSTARLSVCSDTSKISRSSMYLQQDPISEGWIDVAMELGGAPPQLLPRRQSAQAACTAPSSDHHSFSSSRRRPFSLHSHSSPSPSSSSSPSSFPTPHMSPTPSPAAAAAQANDHHHYESPPSSHLLSFPSLNDIKPASPPPSAHNIEPLTYHSVRAAIARNKSQDPQIGPPASAPLSRSSSKTLGTSNGSLQELPLTSDMDLSDLSSSLRRRESSSAASSSQVPTRSILKDTSARDKLQRESWMSEPHGIAVGSQTSRPASALHTTPAAPPKSLARTNSNTKRLSKGSRLSAQDCDQDALTPRPRRTSGYGPDYKPRRQSGGPGHLLYSIDASSSGADFESEEYDESDTEDTQHSKHLQEQYSLLKKSDLVTAGSHLSASSENLVTEDYLAKRGQRKSLGDELNVPPVPEKSSQRKRVSTMGSATLPSLSPNLAATLTSSNGQKPKDRRPVGQNSLSFEPLFTLMESGAANGTNDAQLEGSRDSGTSRLSAISDVDWHVSQLNGDPNQQGVSVLDLSKRELTEIPAGLPTSLTHLRLAYNMIRIFSPIDNLTTLTHLQVLDLCDNQLELLPPEIGLLTKLKELYLSNNKLWKLPDNIQKMARLEVLDIRNNQFYVLNSAVGNLKALRQLDVRHNRLKSLPASLCQLSSTLTVILVDGNQFVQPFADLLQPLMIEDKDPPGSGRQSYLSDDPYGDPANRNSGPPSAKIVSTYEPWRRSLTPNAARRPSTLAKRRSHGDIMSIVGLQKKEESEEGSTTTPDQVQKAITISSVSGAHIASTINSESFNSKRMRSVSTSTVMHNGDGSAPTSSSSSSAHPLSLNKFLKSIRKGGSKSSLKANETAAAVVAVKNDAPNKRYSVGSEGDVLGDTESDAQEVETKPTSKGSSSRRAGTINQWVRERLHKRTNSNEFGTIPDGRGSAASLNMYALDGNETHTARDSGYGGGAITSSGPGSTPSVVGSTPDLSLTLSQGKGSGVLDHRFLNKSTGHLPYPSLGSTREPVPAIPTDERYSYMSTESQMTQESEGADVESVGGPHRLSSVHSPTTPLPSSPVVNGVAGGHGPSTWNTGNPLFGQSAVYLRPLMQYLKDLHDLDPDSSEWEEVYAWRRVWNAERSTATGVDVTRSGTDAQEESSPEKQAKDEEIRLAKLQAQASRRRRIVDEIVATERTYVEGLKGLVEIYLTPALQVMPLSDHKAVFSNAQAIYTFHANHFLPELEKAHRIASTPTQQPSASAGQGARSPTSPLPTSSSFTSDPSAPSSARSSAVPSDAQKDARLSQASTTSATDNAAESATDAAGETIEIKDAPPSAQTTEAEAPAAATPSAEAAIKMAVEDRIGRVFAEHVPYMKMYSFYINNYDNALRVLQTQLTQAKHKKKMKEFLRRCAKHPNHNQLALQGYLLLPVQRIPRYKLLLHDLLENTWPDHPDYQDIAKALDKISSRADEMNERKRQYENHEKVLLIQNRIIGQYKTPLVQPHRKVVREGMLHLIRVVTRNVSMGIDKAVPTNGSVVGQVGDLTVHHLSEETVEKSFLFILFNDIMIQCNTIAANGKSSGGASNGSGTSNGPNGAGPGTTGSGSGASGAAGAGSSGSDGSKNLELCRVLQIESRLHPAEIIGHDVLRVVDDAMIMYLTGDKDVIQSWKDDINSRW